MILERLLKEEVSNTKDDDSAKAKSGIMGELLELRSPASSGVFQEKNQA